MLYGHHLGNEYRATLYHYFCFSALFLKHLTQIVIYNCYYIIKQLLLGIHLLLSVLNALYDRIQNLLLIKESINLLKIILLIHLPSLLDTI